MVVQYHRNTSNPKKSLWTVTEQEEIECFKRAIIELWTYEQFAWGLHIINGQIMPLGINTDNEVLKVAKFVDNNTHWHGYPADYVRKIQDKPPSLVLTKWCELKLITKSQVLKIKQQKCNL
jgi:hypothetical protein